jgi:hypothetical protein
VQNDVQGNVRISQLDRAQHFLGVVHVDIAHHGEAQHPHRLLPVHKQNHARVALLLQGSDLAHPHALQHALPQHGLQSRQHEKDPEQIGRGHRCSFR